MDFEEQSSYLRAEDVLIGAILIETTAINRVDLVGNEFAKSANAEIYNAVQELSKQGEEFDFLAVVGLLDERTGRSWMRQVSTLAKNTLSSRTVESYAAIVKKGFQIRQAQEIANKLAQTVLRDCPGAISEAIGGLMSLNNSKRNYEHTMKQMAAAAMEEIEAAYESDGLVGITSGLTDFDKHTYGFRAPRFYVVGARPSMGKTALLMGFAYSSNVKCGIISAEQGYEELGLRFISMAGEVDNGKLQRADLNDDDLAKVTNACALLSEKEVFAFDKPAPRIIEVVDQARRWKHQYDIQILFVDYIQRLKGSNPRQTKTEQVREVAEVLKELARELGIPIVALAQVKRDVENRKDKRPMMSDLSDASEIEKEADLVTTLYRDEVYHADSPSKGVAELIICKNRHGEVGTVFTSWRGAFYKFGNLLPTYTYE